MELKLTCEHRSETGKNVNNRLRAAGYIPAVIYGKNHPNLPVKLKLAEYLKFKNRNHGKKIIELDYQNEKESVTKTVIIKDYSIDPVSKQLIHFDFYEFNADEKIRFSVPLHYIGQPAGVKQGGILQKNYDEVEVECLPKYAVDSFEVNVANLNFHDVIRIKDLVKNENLHILEDQEAIIVTVAAPAAAPEPGTEITDEVKEPEVIKKGKEKSAEEEA